METELELGLGLEAAGEAATGEAATGDGVGLAEEGLGEDLTATSGEGAAAGEDLGASTTGTMMVEK